MPLAGPGTCTGPGRSWSHPVLAVGEGGWRSPGPAGAGIHPVQGHSSVGYRKDESQAWNCESRKCESEPSKVSQWLLLVIYTG